MACRVGSAAAGDCAAAGASDKGNAIGDQAAEDGGMAAEARPLLGHHLIASIGACSVIRAAPEQQNVCDCSWYSVHLRSH